MPGKTGFDEERRRMDEFVFQRGEFLTELIVKLSRDGSAFLFSGQRHASRESPELRSGRMRLVVGRIPQWRMMCSRRHRPRRYSDDAYLSSDRSPLCRTDAVIPSHAELNGFLGVCCLAVIVVSASEV